MKANKQFEKQLKNIAGKQAKEKLEKESIGKAKEKLFKYEIENLKKQAIEKERKQAKEKLGKVKRLKNLEKLEKDFSGMKSISNFTKQEKENLKESKLKSFSGMYKKENLFNSNFAFNEKDFFIHGIELNENENLKILLYEYNKIQAIGKGMNLNEIEKIILENLKTRLLFEYCENFESNLKKQNSKDIKKLNTFFNESNLKKYIKNSKENESLNIFENENLNIFGKQANNFESEYINKINGKFILNEIGKQESKKAKEKLLNNRNHKKMDENERKAFLNEKHNLKKLSKELKEKEFFLSGYGKEIFEINESINKNENLIQANKQFERIKKKVFEKAGINEKVKKLKFQIHSFEKFFDEIESNEIEISGIENLEYIESYEKAKKQLKEIEKHKKEIEKKIFSLYEKQAKEIINNGKQLKEIEYKKYLKDINNSNSKIKNILNNIENEYSIYLKNEYINTDEYSKYMNK